MDFRWFVGLFDVANQMSRVSPDLSPKNDDPLAKLLANS